MSIVSFATLFPELAERECRTLRVEQPWFETPSTDLPADDYAFREAYCVIAGCDCRRVVLTVYARRAPEKIQAVIRVGLGAKGSAAGPNLVPSTPQGEHAGELLSLAQEVLLADDDYVARLGRHYDLVKVALNDPDDPIHACLASLGVSELPLEPQVATLVRSTAKVGRNEPCPCGTGKKFKRCCAKAPAPAGSGHEA